MVATSTPIYIEEIEGDFNEIRTLEECLNATHYFVEVDVEREDDLMIPVSPECEEESIPNTQCEDEQHLRSY